MPHITDRDSFQSQFINRTVFRQFAVFFDHCLVERKKTGGIHFPFHHVIHEAQILHMLLIILIGLFLRRVPDDNAQIS